MSEHPIDIVRLKAAAKPLGPTPAGAMRMVIGIASAGRPATLLSTFDYLAGLENRPDRIIICVPSIADAAGLLVRRDVEIIIGSRGLTCQRNRILQAAAEGADVVVFLDDDFIPAPDFLARMEVVFRRYPEVVIATGEVLADGILGAGLDMPEALRVIAAAGKRPGRIVDVYNAYGCNMAVRLLPVTTHGLGFDEQLPLYGWLEDVDFSRSIARFGRSVRISGACGVHLGVKGGRQPGRRLGYSQMANPVYLMRKRTMSKARALTQMGRNILANLAGAILGNRSIDRSGRLAGNMRALVDLALGRAAPGRILEFDNPANREMSPSIATKGR